MNIELLQRVRDQIAAQPEHFDLNKFASSGNWHDPKSMKIGFDLCDAVFCIAGTAVVLADGPQDGYFNYENRASELLGLTYGQSRRLFFANDGSVWLELAEEFEWDVWDDSIEDWGQITPEQAVIVLDRIISGEVKL